MNIKTKMFLLALRITLCVTAIAATAAFCVSNLSREFKQLRTHEIVTESTVIKLSRDLNYLSRLSRDIMLGGDYQRDMESVHDIIASVGSHFEMLDKAADNEEIKTLISVARSDAKVWLDITARMMTDLGSVPIEERHKAYQDYQRFLTPNAMKARASFAKILEYTEKHYDKGVQDFEGTIAHSATFIVIISLSAIIIIVASFIVILRTILAEIENRRTAEAALSASEKTARALLDGIDSSAYLIDLDGVILAINSTAVKRAAKGTGEMVGSCLWDHYEPAEIGRERRQKAARVIATGSARKFSDERDGRIFDHTYYPVFDDTGSVVKIAVLAIDVTEQKKAQQALEASERRFRSLIEDAPIGISMCRDLHYSYVNFAYARIFGFSDPGELVGTHIGERVAPHCRDEVVDLALRCAKGEKAPCEYEMVGIRKSGVQFPCLVDVTSLLFDDGAISVSFARDLTERKQAKELMIQAEKMAMIGGLAAGMAHEINNPTGIIIQNLQNIERRLSADSPENLRVAQEIGVSLPLLRSYLERRSVLNLLTKMYSAGERTTKIVSNLLQFSRKSDSRCQPAALTEVIERAVELAANDYDLRKKYDFRRIAIVRDFAPDLPLVPVNATELEQVIINILKNAAQAMAEGGAQEPTIRLTAQRQDQMAVIGVSDNGPGMDEATRKRIFEPFFTTKEVGAGTGLGLSVSYAIITQNHRGVFTVDSEPGRGACFTIKLPLA
jgi:PAS domain S-box-containing protein